MSAMAKYEKQPLVGHAGGPRRGELVVWPRTKRAVRISLHVLLACGLALIFFVVLGFDLYPTVPNISQKLFEAQCPQREPLLPTKNTPGLSRMDVYLDSSEFRNESIARLAGAVRIPSESFDDLGPVGQDRRWDVMYDLAAYLEKTFPLVHDKIQLEKVNTHGLLYTWQGSDDSLKPAVLMAHQDVVPVPNSTISQWTYPPYSGAYDGHYVWGRGSFDCKTMLVGILEAVELLVDAGFQPRRTLVLSFGFDEEASGKEGAGHLASTILDRYGKDGISVIVDEGGGTTALWGATFALPAIAEKGYFDVEVIVRMPGGHSSVPPPHNGIGVMSEFITMIESNLYKPHLGAENPFLGFLQCTAAYAPDFPPEWKELLPSNGDDDSDNMEKLAHELAEYDESLKYLFTTSVAVDVIGGGVKANALPERTTALINHRINFGEHVADIKAHLTKLASGVAEKYNLTLHAFNDEGETPSSITLTTLKAALEPSPVTPTDIDSLTAFAVVAGTTRALYENQVFVAPGVVNGNTDTKHYLNVTKHIFRYFPGWDPDEEEGRGGTHTIDERVSIVRHIRDVKWFSLFIRNIDEADLP